MPRSEGVESARVGSNAKRKETGKRPAMPMTEKSAAGSDALVTEASVMQAGAEVLAVLTNNAWYGNSFAPHQHLEIRSVLSTALAAIVPVSALRGEQGRDDVALQEVDDCHAVVGGDEDSFGH